MSKLQEFLNLGDYYASNGGYLEKKSNAYRVYWRNKKKITKHYQT
jgi:hypothetical protein